MKKRNYYIARKNMPTVESFKDAEGNIIIPTKYLIKESDTNEEKGQKNRMWLAWQKRRNIEPITDLPNYQRVRKRYESDERRGRQYMSIYKEQKQIYTAEQSDRILFGTCHIINGGTAVSVTLCASVLPNQSVHNRALGAATGNIGFGLCKNARAKSRTIRKCCQTY